VTGLVLAMVGTDHHPFDRLVDWVDQAASRRPDIQFVVQHGTSRPPRIADGHEFLEHDRLVQLMTESRAVICHGGPGTIMEARSAGHVPICVPRDPARGEHVDEHQLRFARLVGPAGLVRVVHDPEALLGVLDDTLSTGDVDRARGENPETRRARELLAAELDRLVRDRSPRSLRRHRPQRPGPRDGTPSAR
jgi:UDP-N-acetylglucosamine transferase subunit ALG13